jgi:hypothetical protein
MESFRNLVQIVRRRSVDRIVVIITESSSYHLSVHSFLKNFFEVIFLLMY